MNKLETLDQINAISEYMLRIGAEARSIRTAIVREVHGTYWDDVATVYFDKSGFVKIVGDRKADFEPTEAELKAFEIECPSFVWPEVKIVARWPYDAMPEKLRNAKSDKVLEFRDTKGDLLMMQLRGDVSKNEPKYIPFTLWDDDVIRQAEPDGLLPLWGLHQLQNGHYATAIIHEGAMAARRCAQWVNGTIKDRDEFRKHPWFAELDGALHLGWIGGALNPHRTDWSVLAKHGISRVVIVADNDGVGKSAVPKVAKRLRCPTFSIEFTSDWPIGFDLGDDFPTKMFKTIDGEKFYTGPAFKDVLHPATWATDTIANPSGKGKPITVLRDHFVQQWVHVEELDVYVNLAIPGIIRTATAFNHMCRAFSHSSGTSALLLNSYQSGRVVRMAYRPDAPQGVITSENTAAINVHYPTNIKPKQGDPKPWTEFLEYMFPIESDRKEVERWCATLIAKPGIRMEYGLLLMSGQGIGKNTLGEKILTPLVGRHNTGMPNESMIVDSPYNSWIARKRFIFVGEIYMGQNWKAYHRLKSYVTDRYIDVHEKYLKEYAIENWAHFCICSNAEVALKMEEDDRRWLIALLAKAQWPKSKFKAFYDWLESGGLSIIMHWAEQYGDYVRPGEKAPMTERKRKAIVDSLSDEERDVQELCQMVLAEELAVAFSSKEAHAVAKRAGNKFLSALRLGKVMEKVGMTKHEGEVKWRGSYQMMFLSPAASDALSRAELDDRELRERVRFFADEGSKLLNKM